MPSSVRGWIESCVAKRPRELIIGLLLKNESGILLKNESGSISHQFRLRNNPPPTIGILVHLKSDRPKKWRWLDMEVLGNLNMSQFLINLIQLSRRDRGRSWWWFIHRYGIAIPHVDQKRSSSLLVNWNINATMEERKEGELNWLLWRANSLLTRKRQTLGYISRRDARRPHTHLPRF